MQAERGGRGGSGGGALPHWQDAQQDPGQAHPAHPGLQWIFCCCLCQFSSYTNNQCFWNRNRNFLPEWNRNAFRILICICIQIWQKWNNNCQKMLSNVSNLDPDSNVLADPDPCRPKLSLLGLRLLPEPEYPLEEFKKTYDFFYQTLRIRQQRKSGSGFSNIFSILIPYIAEASAPSGPAADPGQAVDSLRHSASFLGKSFFFSYSPYSFRSRLERQFLWCAGEGIHHREGYDELAILRLWGQVHTLHPAHIH